MADKQTENDYAANEFGSDDEMKIRKAASNQRVSIHDKYRGKRFFLGADQCCQ
jgi:hypothetical protein